MRKISFGSFPLIEVRKEDRRCLDQYLIKTFSDNISISDAIRNLSVTKNLMYITPDAIMKSWLGGELSTSNSRVNVNDRESNSVYNQALKRAFFILKEFYKKIKNAPFYKEYIYYPIYVEKIDKIDVGGRSDIDEQYTEVQMNYSFVILSNDLTKGLKIDDIRYDENASLNFLFLFTEFFSGGSFGKSIHDYNQTNHEFLIKLYQFIEQSGKDPIHMTMDLYKLLGMVKDASEKRKFLGSAELGKKIDTSINSAALKKYKGMLKHRILDIIKRSSGSTTPARPEDFQEAFVQIMNAIFKAEDLQGLYDEVDSSSDFNERMKFLYNSNKYKEILSLSTELIKYNKLNCKDVVTMDTMDFDFKVERGDYEIETQSSIIAQKYQTFFKDYVKSISNYLESIIEQMVKKLKLPDILTRSISSGLTSNTKEVTRLQAAIDANNTRLDTLIPQLEIETRLMDQTSREARQGNRTSAAIYPTHRANVDKISREINELRRDISNFENELKQREVLLGNLNSLQYQVNAMIADTNSDLYSKMKDNILSAIANDLTFIYDEGKRFFTNELVAKGFIDLSSNSTYDILSANGNGFKKAVNDLKSKVIKPTTKTNRSTEESDNPAYYAAEVLSSLTDSFDMTAKDAILAIRDAIKPAVSEALINANKNLSNKINKNSITNSYVTSALDEEKMIMSILNSLDAEIESSTVNGVGSAYEKYLRDNVLRNRFISKVLKNFNKLFSIKRVDKVIEFDKNVSQLHPMIKKLINKNSGGGRNCQYFKSFIISYELCEQLYRIKFIVDTHKFTKGLVNKPPKRASNPLSRIQTVLFEYLGLKDNPVWILSKTDVYLSMPDDLSLTNTSILSKISKNDLKEVCRIKPADYWKEGTLGTVAEFGDKRIARWHKEIETERTRIEEWKSEKVDTSYDDKDHRKRLDGYIDKAQKKINSLEDKISKVKTEEKTYTPNAFLFGDSFDDTDRAENEPLLSDTEKAELQKNKEELKTKLHDLNPFDDTEVEQMEKILEKKRQDHPLDLMDEKTKKSDDVEKELSDFEKFMNMREDYFNKDKK